jgi:hypothetical protein
MGWALLCGWRASEHQDQERATRLSTAPAGAWAFQCPDRERERHYSLVKEGIAERRAGLSPGRWSVRRELSLDSRYITAAISPEASIAERTLQYCPRCIPLPQGVAGPGCGFRARVKDWERH